jgi:TRAP-type C4-dicarboxylate transport system permease small subunit
MAAPEGQPAALAAPQAVRRLADRWHRAERWLAMSAFMLIAALLILDVTGRELLGPLLRRLGADTGNTGIPGAQQIAVFALVVGAFCGIGIVTASNSALVPRVAFGWIPRAWAPAMNRVADALTGSLMLVVAWYALQFVLASKSTSMRAPVLSWEVWPFQLAIPAGFVSAALRCYLFAAWPGLKPPPPEHQE